MSAARRADRAPRVLVYGAHGYTGSEIVSAASGHWRCTQAARRGGGAETLRLELGDTPALQAALRNHDVVLNCAGPFVDSFTPLVDACLETGTHYLDITGEWQVFEALRARDAEASSLSVMLLPGVGFDVVATDCLAAHVAQRLPGASRLELGLSALELVSRGSARTILGSAGEKVRRRRAGRLVEEARVRETRFDFGEGPRAAHAVSWGDISTAHHSTGIADIEVFFEATPLVMAMGLANRSFGWIMKSGLGDGLRRAQAGMLPRGPAPHVRAGLRTVVVARAEDAAGRRVEARLVTPEAYSFTVDAAVEIVRRVLDGEVRPGFQTPSSLFSADFVLGFDGVERKDLI